MEATNILVFLTMRSVGSVDKIDSFPKSWHQERNVVVQSLLRFMVVTKRRLDHVLALLIINTSME